MITHLHPGHPKQQRKRERLSRHAWILILMLVFVFILALCGRSVSAQVTRSEELIEKALALEPDATEGGRLSGLLHRKRRRRVVFGQQTQ